MHNPERGRALLLTGPQHFDERRPFSASWRRYYEDIDPLGIAIISTFLKRFQIETQWRPMQPNKMNQLEKAIQGVGAVFISSRHFDTSLAEKTIKVANKYKKPVIVGGYGPTLNPQAFQEATSIVRGEAEPIIGQIVDHLLTGNLDPLYDATTLPPHNLENYVRPDRSIFPKPPRFGKAKKYSQEWQRGCSNSCSFCSPIRLQKGGVRTREIPDIVAEIESMGIRPGDFLLSTDLNTTAIPPESLFELFEHLKIRGIRWLTEGTVAPLLEDLEKVGEKKSLLRLMSATESLGGCYSFLYGADDLAQEKVSGSHNKERRLLGKAVNTFRNLGIPLNLSIVVGLDHHQFPETFFQTASILKKLQPPYTFLHIATPYQGTPWGNLVYEQKRVFDPESTHFNHRQAVAHPKKMTAGQLEQGFYWLSRQLYNPQEISQTLKKNLSPSIMAKNPTLGILLSGLPWSMETYFSTLELAARGYIDPKVQRILDNEYQSWRKKEADYF